MRNLLLSTVTLLVVPAVAIAAPNFSSHTHTTPIELKPISSSSGLKLAGVCFLGAGDCGDGGYDVDTSKQCLNEGYVKNNCNSVQTPTAYCPYDKSYISGCKCASNLISCPAGQVGEGDACEGKYASCKCDPNLSSCPSNKIGSGASCGGKYQSCVCKSEYVYTSSNCTSPRSVSGSSCDGKYTECSCPNGVSSGSYGCKEYYASPCSSVCKVAYPDNCHNRTDKNSQTYGCMKYYDDCPTKCETPYKDNCRNRTEVTVPANATCSTYFSDCSSKCSAWNCVSGYELKDGICTKKTPVCQIGYIYYSDNTCLPYTEHNSDKTALGVVVYVIDGGKHGQIAAVDEIGFVKYASAYKYVDVPGLTNYIEDTLSEAYSDFDSCGHTNIITSYGDANAYPAAWLAKNYAPTPETKGKWCLPTAAVAINIGKYSNRTADKKDGVLVSAYKALGIDCLPGGRYYGVNEIPSECFFDGGPHGVPYKGFAQVMTSTEYGEGTLMAYYAYGDYYGYVRGQLNQYLNNGIVWPVMEY